MFVLPNCPHPANDEVYQDGGLPKSFLVIAHMHMNIVTLLFHSLGNLCDENFVIGLKRQIVLV